MIFANDISEWSLVVLEWVLASSRKTEMIIMENHWLWYGSDTSWKILKNHVSAAAKQSWKQINSCHSNMPLVEKPWVPPVMARAVVHATKLNKLSREKRKTAQPRLVSNRSGWWCNNHLEKQWSSSMGRMTTHIWNGK